MSNVESGRFRKRSVNAAKTEEGLRERESDVISDCLCRCFGGPVAHISAGVEYALHCLLFLVEAEQIDQPASARDLAELQKISPSLSRSFSPSSRRRASSSPARELAVGLRLRALPATSLRSMSSRPLTDASRSLNARKFVASAHCSASGRPPGHRMVSAQFTRS